MDVARHVHRRDAQWPWTSPVTSADAMHNGRGWKHPTTRPYRDTSGAPDDRRHIPAHAEAWILRVSHLARTVHCHVHDGPSASDATSSSSRRASPRWRASRTTAPGCSGMTVPTRARIPPTCTRTLRSVPQRNLRPGRSVPARSTATTGASAAMGSAFRRRSAGAPWERGAARRPTRALGLCDLCGGRFHWAGPRHACRTTSAGAAGPRRDSRGAATATRGPASCAICHSRTRTPRATARRDDAASDGASGDGATSDGASTD